MSAAGFYVAAVLLILSCAAAVVLRSGIPSAAAAAGVAVSLGVFLLVSGEYLLALLEILLLLATLATVVEVARRGGFGPQARPLPLGRWVYGLTLAALAVVVLDGAALAARDGWFSSGTKQGLSHVLQHQAPVTAALLVILGAVAVGVAVVIGRTSADEAEHHQRVRARREREERMRRRREDRVAARRRRLASRSGEGE